MANQKQRYEIKNMDLETLNKELEEAVKSGEYPLAGYQTRKTFVINRDSIRFPRSILNYLIGGKN